MFDRIQQLGGLMVTAGLLSMVLYFADYNLKVLAWVDLWGPVAGWAIRAGLVVGGAALAAAPLIIQVAMSSPDELEGPAIEAPTASDSMTNFKV